MQDAMNKQINAEIWSAYLYLSMSAWYEHQNLPGFANWMKIQAQEEMTHAMKFFRFINERGGRVVLSAIDKTDIEWKSALHAFEDTLEHEKKVTAMIDNLMDIAIEEKDHASRSMLTWFVDEQVEEEANATSLIEQLKMIGTDRGPGMLMLDRELATRVFVDSTQTPT
jgi:ferritin